MLDHNNPLSIIYQKRQGRMDDLRRSMDEHQIRQLEAMGYIVNAPSKYGDTWKISKKALEIAKLRFHKSSWLNKIDDWFLINVKNVALA